MNASARTMVLAGVLVVIGALVALDRAGLLPGGAQDAADAATSGEPAGEEAPRARYLRLARELSDANAQIQAHANWAECADQAQAQWGEVSESIISEASVALADQRLADTVKQALARRAGVTGLLVTPRTKGEPADASPGAKKAKPQLIRVLTLEVRFETRDALALWRVLGELETLRGVTSRIISVRLDGPGFKQTDDAAFNQVSASVVIEALALIAPEGGRA